MSKQQKENHVPEENLTPDKQVNSIAGVSKYVQGDEMKSVFSMMEKLLHWAAIIESSDDAIISKSMDGHITSWNRGAQALYGYAADEVIGKPVSLLMPKGYEDDFPMIINKLRQGEKIDHYETKRVTKDGRMLDVSITVSPIKDSHGNMIGASKIARDISERIEHQRRRDDFFGATSHELNTPITSQKLYGELLEEMIDKNGDTQYKPYIQKINRQTNKLQKLVRSLLELSQAQSGRMELVRESFEISELLDEVVSDLREAARHDIYLADSVKCLVRGDRERIGQVMINLLLNSAKFSPEDSRIKVSSVIEQGRVLVSVQDFGIGIPKEYHEKVFEPFFRISGTHQFSTYPGIGIGLTFCEQIISRHGGEIWIDGNVDEGTIFRFSLPMGEDL